MMTTYAYLRVSTDQQDVDNQRYGLFLYANIHELGPLQFVEDTASGRLAWRDRAVGRLLTETVHPGDAVLFAEISRMARSTLQVLEMLEHCMRQGVSVHIAKQQLVLDGSIQSRITATVLGLAAEIEREMIALRTTEALAKRKAAGLPLGRPKGTHAARRKLDAKAGEIQGYLAKGISKRSIAKLVECAPSTLYDWLARRNLRSRQATTARRS
jgi:DNA invertase Pin-like site-specific DNA recombinase